MKITGKRIVVAPLNWGLGHASRCISLIQALLDQQNEVAIASDGGALELLRNHFPQLDYFTLPAYNITYASESMVKNMLTQIPKLTWAIRTEHKAAEEIIKEYKAEVLISDNRLGFHSKHAYSIYITHQLDIPVPSSGMRKIINGIHRRYIKKYNECWVPDYEGEKRLAGKMSLPFTGIKPRYLGPLTRMEALKMDQDIDVSVILSGPEPQRTRLEEMLFKKLSASNYNIHIVSGTSSAKTPPSDSHITHDPVLYGEQLNELIVRSKLIISRAGYSSLMDLDKLEKKAILIPTPGQYEQEYLASYHKHHSRFSFLAQKEVESKLLEKIAEIID